MMTDPAAVGRMIAWGLRPRQQPSRNADYAGLVARWHADDAFAADVAAVAGAQGLRILECSRIHGLVLAAADEESPYAMSVNDYLTSVTGEVRLLHGFVHLAIALAAYPTAADLEIEDATPQVTAEAVAELMARLVARIRQAAGNEDPRADEPMLEPLYRVVARAPEEKQSADDRANPRTHVGAVKKALRVLEEQGLADRDQARPNLWRMRTRYRIHVLDAAGTAGEALEELRRLATGASV
jgi:hypothetical protein